MPLNACGPWISIASGFLRVKDGIKLSQIFVCFASTSKSLHVLCPLGILGGWFTKDDHERASNLHGLGPLLEPLAFIFLRVVLDHEPRCPK